MTQQTIPISAIHVDAGAQARVTIDQATVKEYAEEMDGRQSVFPPLEVVEAAPGSYVLWDGFHRLGALKLLNRTKAVANVRPGTAEDARWLAVGANRAHGLRRTNADKRRAVELALSQKPDMSDRAIAEHVGVAPTTVGTIRASLSNLDSQPITRQGRDGRTISTSNIGKPTRSLSRLDSEGAGNGNNNHPASATSQRLSKLDSGRVDNHPAPASSPALSNLDSQKPAAATIPPSLALHPPKDATPEQMLAWHLNPPTDPTTGKPVRYRHPDDAYMWAAFDAQSDYADFDDFARDHYRPDDRTGRMVAKDGVVDDDYDDYYDDDEEEDINEDEDRRELLSNFNIMGDIFLTCATEDGGSGSARFNFASAPDGDLKISPGNIRAEIEQAAKKLAFLLACECDLDNPAREHQPRFTLRIAGSVPIRHHQQP